MDARQRTAIAGQEHIGGWQSQAGAGRAENVDDAIRLANASSYGLTASIFSSDLANALRFADEAEFGIVKINKATTGNEIHVPFGGRKHSGSGPPEMGWATWDFYTQWKTVYISAPPS